MRILLHTCCGPCSIFPLRVLAEEGWQISALYYNPNIHPYREWQRRLETLQTYLGEREVPLAVPDEYDLKGYLESVLPWADHKGNRCAHCYRLRLREAARQARAGGYDTFTTTLLVSPYQDHQAVAEAGREAQEEAGLPFLYRDFRSGWKEAVAESRALGMYRQPYCGCVFSERERYFRPGRLPGVPPGSMSGEG